MDPPISTPNGNITIRIATPADADALLDLRLEALSLHPEAFAADVEKTATAGAQAWIDRINEYAADQSGAMFIACAGDKVIGMTGIVRGHWPKTRHFGSIYGVYVNPDWRGKRIGDGMIDACIEWANTAGITVINLGVNTMNISAIQCYKRCGFTVYGTEPRSIYYNNTYYDEYLMVRLL